MVTALVEINCETLWEKIESGAEFVLVDALSPISYAGAHLPGAINIPPPSVDDRLIELGYRNVRHYAGGKRDWREAGLPLEGGRV